jgi:hypothetical protein
MIGAAAATVPLAGYLSASSETYLRPARDRSVVQSDAQNVKDNYTDQDLVDYGILDVTKGPYNVDNTGSTDVTQTLGEAAQDASDARMILYLPAGTYKITDDIRHIQNPYKSNGSGWPRFRGHDHPLCIWGDGIDETTIKLADGSSGYGDTSSPKTMITLATRVAWSDKLKPNGNYNQHIKGLTLDTGSNNPGAIGIDHQGAQLSTTEDIKIDATGSYIGLRGGHGSGGATANIEVIGGEYGLYLDGSWELEANSGSQPTPVYRNVTLTNQTTNSAYITGRGTINIVGAEIDSAPIELAGKWNDNNGQLNLVDVAFQSSGSNPLITGNRPVYMYNTYMKGPSTLVDLNDSTLLGALSSTWTHVREYAEGPSGRTFYRDGSSISGPVEDLDTASTAPELRKKHDWNRDHPNWNDSNVANVKADYGAAGDKAQTDDYAAIQQAIDENKYVFLPKGIYGISQPLTLDSDTYLFGLGTFSNLTPHATYLDSGSVPNDTPAAYDDRFNANPHIETVDDANANCSVAFLKLHARVPGSYAIHWQAGRQSAVRAVEYKRWESLGDRSNIVHPGFLINGNGGGRWQTLVGHGPNSEGAADYRHALVENTTEPLHVYEFNVEHATSDYQSEFNNVENVDIYGLKTETTPLADSATPPLLVKDSKKVGLFGHGSNVESTNGITLFQIDNTEDFVIANFGTGSDKSGNLIDSTESDGDSLTVDDAEEVVYYSDKSSLYKEPTNVAGATVPKAANAPSIDATEDSLWDDVTARTCGNVVSGSRSGSSDLSADWKAVWDDTNLYVFVDVTDDTLTNDSSSTFKDDSVELFLDGDHSEGTSYDGTNDFQLKFGYNDSSVSTGPNSVTDTTGISFATTSTSDGWNCEIEIPWSTIGVTPNDQHEMGFDVLVNDDDDGGDRDCAIAWADTNNDNWENPSSFGDVTLDLDRTV